MNKRFIIVLIAFMNMIVPLSLDMYLPAVPHMTAAFNTTESTVNLTLVGFFFFMAIGTLIFGPLSDKYGRRGLLVAGTLVYTIFSAACALATSIWLLIIARVLQALGAGCMVAISTAMIKDCFDRRTRNTILAVVQAMAVIAPMLAPIVGAFIVTHAGWRATFAVLAARSRSFFSKKPSPQRSATQALSLAAWACSSMLAAIQDSLCFSAVPPCSLRRIWATLPCALMCTSISSGCRRRATAIISPSILPAAVGVFALLPAVYHHREPSAPNEHRRALKPAGKRHRLRIVADQFRQHRAWQPWHGPCTDPVEQLCARARDFARCFRAHRLCALDRRHSWAAQRLERHGQRWIMINVGLVPSGANPFLYYRRKSLYNEGGFLVKPRQTPGGMIHFWGDFSLAFSFRGMGGVPRKPRQDWVFRLISQAESPLFYCAGTC